MDPYYKSLTGEAALAKIQADTDSSVNRKSAAKDIALTIVLDGKQLSGIGADIEHQRHTEVV